MLVNFNQSYLFLLKIARIMSENTDLPEIPGLFVDLHAKVSPVILATILGVNVSLVYQESQAGRLPSVLTEATYLECLHMYLAYFKKRQELALEKERNAHELRMQKQADAARIKEEAAKNKSSGKSFGGDDGAIPTELIITKYKQDIKVNMAREAQLWLRIAVEKEEYLVVNELNELVKPFLMTIRDMLISLSFDNPSVSDRIDDIMSALYDTGVALLQDSAEDKATYVQTMLNMDVSDV